MSLLYIYGYNVYRFIHSFVSMSPLIPFTIQFTQCRFMKHNTLKAHIPQGRIYYTRYSKHSTVNLLNAMQNILTPISHKNKQSLKDQMCAHFQRDYSFSFPFLLHTWIPNDIVCSKCLYQLHISLSVPWETMNLWGMKMQVICSGEIKCTVSVIGNNGCSLNKVSR